MKNKRFLRPPFIEFPGGKAFGVYGIPKGDNDTNNYASNLQLYEDGTPLYAAHQHNEAVAFGGGRYSHWGRRLRFSASDGSNPNTNGRTYEYDYSLDLDTWERERIARWSARWRWHPEGGRFLDLGGHSVPPPLIANLALTNKCNLRCEICGSQKHLDRSGIRRRHMDFENFEAVAATLFPVLAQVELNSQGDPLLHPYISNILKHIAAYRCEVKIQHNGTLLSDPVVDLLLQQTGTIMLSLDAVGAKFDEVRQGGVWAKAVTGLERLLRERDPRRLTIGVYPTVTKRTVGEMETVVKWAAKHGVDQINFHRYVPILGSWEEQPGAEAERMAIDRLRKWCIRSGNPVHIQFEGESLNSVPLPSRRAVYADPEKAAALLESGKMMFPTQAGTAGSDRLMTCAAPNEYVEIGLDGQIGACCRAQDVSLGRAVSVDDFARAWFGANYTAIRRSLQRGATMPYPLPNCAGCLKFFAPGEALGRSAVNYSEPSPLGELCLSVEAEEELQIDEIQKEEGYCFIVRFPLGLHGGGFELLEDEKILGSPGTQHAEIRQHGKGRYHLDRTVLYFSSSDGTDPRRNGRRYRLRRTNSLSDAVKMHACRTSSG
ncbi:MAG: radical SAM protein [Cutibacterium sp.]|nr:radical SAM protein [Cutibacterium sp.]